MPYKYNKTIMNGAERLIEGIENIEMFLDDNDDWNFHDSEIYSLHWDISTKTFTVSVYLIGCDFYKLKDYDSNSKVILDLHFEKCLEVHMPNVSLCNSQYIYEIGMSIHNGYLECWFDGYPIKITSERLRVDHPRVLLK